MTLKIGGGFELKDVDIKTSTIEYRKLFLEAAWKLENRPPTQAFLNADWADLADEGG